MAADTTLIESERRQAAHRAVARFLTWSGLLTILAASFALRVFRLDAQSLWYDEGVSVVMAPRDLATITANAAGDIHPPLYYHALHFWTGLVGTSEFGARFLSVVYGVALVALVYQLGRRLFSREVGLAGAFLTAGAPFLIYYSQEARMYMQVTTLGALSMLLFVRLIVNAQERPNRRGWPLWVAYALATSATLYSQYFGITIVVAQNLHFWLLSGRQRTLWGKWVTAQLAIAISFLPWLPVMLRQFGGWPSISEPFTFGTLLERVFKVFSLGLSWDAAATTNREIAFLIILAAAGLYPVVGNRKGMVRNLILLALYALVPVLLMYALSIQRPMYNPKLLLVATPAYYCALGLGAIGLARTVGRLIERAPKVAPLGLHSTQGNLLSLGLGALVALAALGSLSYSYYHSASAYYFDPKYARDDYRGLVRYVEAHARPGDVIVLNAPGQVEIFDYYYDGNAPLVPLPQQRPIDERLTEQELRNIAGTYSRVWLVLWAVPEADPGGFIEGWLDRQSFKALNNWFGSVRLCLYNTQENAAALRQEVDLRFGDKISLTSWEIGGGELRPGEALPLTLKWVASEPVLERYTVFAHILDKSELICGQRDSEPGGGARVTTSWAPGETIIDRYAIPILLGTPPGEYRVEIGLYNSQTGQRLPIKDSEGVVIGDRHLIGPVMIGRALSAPATDLLGFEQPSSAVFDGRLRLLGHSVDALGRPPDYVNYVGEDTLQVTLFWQPQAALGADYRLEVRLQDGAGKVVAQHLLAMAGGQYPPSQWQPGEVIRDQHRVPLAGLAGEYTLSVALRPSEAENAVNVTGSTGANSHDVAKVRVGQR
ncbi:MAG: glycosyltransferase family 39 protein [Chloroflexota bacterium]